MKLMLHHENPIPMQHYDDSKCRERYNTVFSDDCCYSKLGGYCADGYEIEWYGLCGGLLAGTCWGGCYSFNCYRSETIEEIEKIDCKYHYEYFYADKCPLGCFIEHRPTRKQILVIDQKPNEHGIQCPEEECIDVECLGVDKCDPTVQPPGYELHEVQH